MELAEAMTWRSHEQALHSRSGAGRVAAPCARARALRAERRQPPGLEGHRRARPRPQAAIAELYLPHWRAYTEQTGAAAVLADPSSFDARAVRMIRGADDYARSLADVPVHLVIGVQLGDLAVTDAGLDRRASSAARPSTRSSRTCCSLCGARNSVHR